MTMKKLLLPVCLLLAGVINANAQGVAVGLRAGLNFANQSVSSGTSPSSYTSFVAGAYAKIMFSGKMGIQPELLYNALGAKDSDPTLGTITTKTNYLSIPVLLRFNVVPQVHLLAGPQFGILLSAKSTFNTG